VYEEDESGNEIVTFPLPLKAGSRLNALKTGRTKAKLSSETTRYLEIELHCRDGLVVIAI
jgi:hypothetical protein